MLPQQQPNPVALDLHEFTYVVFGFAALFFILWLARRNRSKS